MTPVSTADSCSTRSQPTEEKSAISYNADYFANYEDNDFFGTILNRKISVGINTEQKEQPRALDELVYMRLCEITELETAQISIPVLIDNQPHQFVLNGNNGKTQILLANGKVAANKEFIICVAELKKRLAAHVAHTLHESVSKLTGDPYCLAWVEATPLAENKTAFAFHIKQNQEYADLAIFSVLNSKGELPATADTGTMIKDDGLFATTVVDGSTTLACNRSIPIQNLPTYSAIITSAAMHTMRNGILVHGLDGDNLQTFFVELIKLLLSAHGMPAGIEHCPAFKGVVLFEQRYFAYAYDGHHVIVENLSSITDNNQPIDIEPLTATENTKNREVLQVDIDVASYLFKDELQKEDFEFFPIPKTPSSSYKYVAKSVQTESTIQTIERAKTNNTVDIVFNPQLIEAEEEYYGIPSLVDTKLDRQKEEIKELKEQKKALLIKLNEVARLDKLVKSPEDLRKGQDAQRLKKEFHAQLNETLNVLQQPDLKEFFNIPLYEPLKAVVDILGQPKSHQTLEVLKGMQEEVLILKNQLHVLVKRVLQILEQPEKLNQLVTGPRQHQEKALNPEDQLQVQPDECRVIIDQPNELLQTEEQSKKNQEEDQLHDPFREIVETLNQAKDVETVRLSISNQLEKLQSTFEQQKKSLVEAKKKAALLELREQLRKVLVILDQPELNPALKELTKNQEEIANLRIQVSTQQSKVDAIFNHQQSVLEKLARDLVSLNLELRMVALNLHGKIPPKKVPEIPSSDIPTLESKDIVDDGQENNDEHISEQPKKIDEVLKRQDVRDKEQRILEKRLALNKLLDDEDKRKKIQLLQNQISEHQSKIDSVLEKKEVLDKELQKQNKFDQIILKWNLKALQALNDQENNKPKQLKNTK